MKKLLFLLMITATIAKAQWYALPDTNFRNALIQFGFGSCMNATQDSIDSDCIFVDNTNYLTIFSSGINDLTGILAFKNLQSLECFDNNLSTLPNLPDSLIFLDCSNNNISSIQGSLPSSLGSFICFNNLLTSLPNLPNSLTELNCSSNPISCLPILPNSLYDLNIYNTSINCFPNFPIAIQNLDTNILLCTAGNNNSCYVCSSQPNFTLVADTTTPHNYFAINQSSGAGNLQYVWHWGDNSIADTIANPTHIYAASGYYNICVTVTDSSGCGNTFCDSSTYITKSNNAIISVTVISATTGIHQLKSKDAVSLFPNPTTSSFQISNTQNIKNISIKNILGKEIFQTNKINKSVVDIDITDYSAGVYFVELQSDNATITKKIVKQ